MTGASAAVEGSCPVADAFAARVQRGGAVHRLDNREPQPACNGCGLCSLAGPFGAKPAKIRRLLRSDLEPHSTWGLANEMRAAGLPT